MNDLLTYLVPIILVGYIIYNLIRLYFNRKLDQQRKDYEKVMEEQMKKLERDIFERSRDLQDSMQMINQEYSKLMKDLSLQQRQEAQRLQESLREFKDKHPRPEGSEPPHAPDE
jgi:flagellar biosynthesis/type III secretory pathway M-ring protein FliF/YscJ